MMPQFGAGMGCGQVAYEETLQEVSPAQWFGFNSSRVPRTAYPVPYSPSCLLFSEKTLTPDQM
jgi:hypothetical protein